MTHAQDAPETPRYENSSYTYVANKGCACENVTVTCKRDSNTHKLAWSTCSKPCYEVPVVPELCPCPPKMTHA
eukprot:CAMPEP_0119105558 /NCGR_PEP_ID=MMETSP1180-20130426/3488_1 /TAXON_ID=3052 ORGANISM="Chlamydomonas cf sp, Strain CCMP681" /NCGR_SAMPLE_ID=MMETSP1180 /ASSEMBLY_ACC=CAM_ASM_000741 /LENGTH=72 /DNA_ID=CAMNT_0007090635 /DNA_START=19 /DNA_END=234 /DNA_ORIENTATION=+